MKNGVPYDVAMCLDDSDRLAHMVVIGEFEGNKWSWDEMSWVDREEEG